MLNEFFPSQIVTQLEQKQPFSEPFRGKFAVAGQQIAGASENFVLNLY
jgi:hypothetical protein